MSTFSGEPQSGSPPKTDCTPPSVSAPAGTRLDCDHTCENPATIYDQQWTPGTYDHKLTAIEDGWSPAVVNREADDAIKGVNRKGALSGTSPSDRWVRDEDTPASTKQSTTHGGRQSRIEYVPEWEGPREGYQLGRTTRDQKLGDGDPYERTFRGDDGLVRCAQCAIDRQNGVQPTAAQRSSDADAALKQARASWHDSDKSPSSDTQSGRNTGGLNSTSSGSQGDSKRGDSGSKSDKPEQKKRRRG